MRKLALPFAALVLLALPAFAAAAPLPEGPGSPLILSPSPTVVPKATVGSNGASLEVEIFNPGEDAAIQNVSLEGSEAGEFFFNGSNCGPLAEGQKCVFTIGLKPTSVGLKQATVGIAFQGGRAPESFAISGEGVLPLLEFEPPAYDFGLERINRETVHANIQLSNKGEAAVQINNSEIQGDTGVFWTGNSNCFSGSIEPGQSCSIELNFNPHELATYSGELRVSAAGSIFTAAISGEGGRSIVDALENPFRFPDAKEGSEGPVQTITIANSGNLPAGFFIGIIAGGDSGSFRLLDENCTGAELMPATTCAAHIRFTPQGAGAKLARLAFFGDGDDGTMILLQGEGLASGAAARTPPPAPAAATKATLAPSGFNFGGVYRGRSAPAHSFAIRNDGIAPLPIGSAAIIGRNVDQFRRARDECTGVTLLPGGECTIRVVFAPRGAGVKSATLRVSTEGGAYTASLAGQGLPKSGLQTDRGDHRPHQRGPRR